MSIPIKDINAGDTVSSMVDKINYNFDLLALKGGGPQGLQGVQGVRGSVGLQGVQGLQGLRGAGMSNGEGAGAPTDVPGSYSIGDTYIDGEGNIYTLTYTDHYEWINIFNPTELTESPFIFHFPNGTDDEDGKCIIPIENRPLILGFDSTNSYDVSAINTMMYMNDLGDEKGHLNFTVNGSEQFLVGIWNIGDALNPSRIAHIEYANDISTDVIKIINEQSNFQIGNQNSTSFETRLMGEVALDGYDRQVQSTNRVIVTASESGGRIIFTPSWYIDGSLSSLFPEGTYDIGKDGNRIKDTYIEPDGVMYTGTISQTQNKFPKIKYGSIGDTNNTIAAISKNGISVGIESAAYANNFLDSTTFGVLVGNELNGNGYAPNIKLKANSTSIDSNAEIVQQTAFSRVYVGITPYIKNRIGFTSQANKTAFLNESISPTVGAYRISDKLPKNVKDMLCVRGRTSECGSDVLIQGGDSVSSGNISTDFYNVGGNVYISGGSAYRNANGEISDLPFGVEEDSANLGNVIIGINPLKHETISQDNYGSLLRSDGISATNPNGIRFFDVCDVAIHGNRIVIDSHANARKYEEYVGELGTSSYQMATLPIGAYNQFRINDGTPMINDVECSTLQISALNTIVTETPILLETSDIYYHQFLNGVMSYAIGIYCPISDEDDKHAKTNSVYEIPKDDFYALLNGVPYSEGNTANAAYWEKLRNSLILTVHQTWQKVGNTVNVSARCEWYAFDNNPAWGDNGVLRRIHNGLFTFVTSNPINHVSKWANESNAYNKTVAKIAGTVVQDADQSVYWYINKNVFGGKSSSCDLENQPQTILRVPVSIKNMRNMYCYGNGGIFTEGLNCMDEYSKETLGNSNVFVGNEPCFESSYYRQANSTNEDARKTTYHNFGRLIRADFSAGGVPMNYLNDFYGMTFDWRKRFDFSSYNRTSIWGEKNFIQTDCNNSKTAKYTYIVPTMVYDKAYYDGIDDYKSLLRPVVGLYTAMNLNYTYILGERFNNVPFVSYRKYDAKNITISTHDIDTEIVTEVI